MRNFSNFEQHALSIMVIDNPLGMSRQNLETLVKNMFYERGAEFIFDHSQKKLTIKVYAKKPEEYTQANVIANQLVELMVLIEYLNSQYLSRLYSMGSSPIAQSTSNLTKEGALIIQDTNLAVYEFYSTHWNDFFYVSDELRHIVSDNKFKTDDQLYVEKQLAEAEKQTLSAHKQLIEAKEQTRLAQVQTEKAQSQLVEAEKQTTNAINQLVEAQKQVRNSWIAIIIAVIALLVSIVSPLFIDKKNVKQEEKVTNEYIITTPQDSTLYKVTPTK